MTKKRLTVKDCISQSTFTLDSRNEYVIIGAINSHNKRSMDYIPKFKDIKEFDLELRKAWLSDITILDTELTDDQIITLLFTELNAV